jgi:hypothetical protein
MNLEMRKKLAGESWEEKIRKVGMLVALIKSAPKLGQRKSHSDVNPTAAKPRIPL